METDVTTRLMTLAEREQYGMPPIEWFPVPPRAGSGRQPVIGVRVAGARVKDPYIYITRAMATRARESGRRFLRVGWDPKTRSLVLAPDARQGWPIPRDGRFRDITLMAWWDAQGWPRGVWLPGQEAPDGVWWVRLPDPPGS